MEPYSQLYSAASLIFSRTGCLSDSALMNIPIIDPSNGHLHTATQRSRTFENVFTPEDAYIHVSTGLESMWVLSFPKIFENFRVSTDIHYLVISQELRHHITYRDTQTFNQTKYKDMRTEVTRRACKLSI